jgi:hypothetical protein
VKFMADVRQTHPKIRRGNAAVIQTMLSRGDPRLT